MKKFDYYEFVGVLTPGAVGLYGLSKIYPDLHQLTSGDMKLGEFGIVVIAAYVMGHLMHAFGNFLEWLWWKAAGGWPSDWPRSAKRHLLAPQQIAALHSKIRKVLKIDCPEKLGGIAARDWQAIVAEMYAVIRKAGRAERVDIFNANYSMFRGIVSALLVVLITSFIAGEDSPCRIYGVLIIALCLALLRMNRFGRHYARELFVEFLSVQPGELEKAKEQKEENKHD